MDFKTYQTSRTGLLTRIRRNPIPTAAVLLMTVAALANTRTISHNMQTLGEVQAIAQSNSSVTQKMQADQLFLEEQAAIAQKRYEQGCIIVVASNDPTQFTALSEGQPVIDLARDTPLPAGSVVCDALGNTAVIKANADGEPVASDLAFTGNKEAVEQAIARQQVEGEYNPPTLK